MSKENVKKPYREKEAGMSLIESLPLIMVLASLIGFLLGLWGVSHKHVLHSIAARNYAFETFSHRANLTYFNDSRSVLHSYEESQMRYHAVGDNSGDTLKALTTPMRFPAEASADSGPPILHRQQIWNESILPTAGEGTIGTKRPWVMVGYGMCLNADCGG